MRIGIDYRLASSSYRGMGRYCREITRKIAELDLQNQYILYSADPVSESFPNNFKVKIIPTRNYILGEQIYIPYYAKKDELDVLWSPANTFPLFLAHHIKQVVTIHDLIFLEPTKGTQTLHQKIGRFYRRMIIKFGKKHIDQCLTVSKYSAQIIMSKLKLNNIGITYNSVETFYNSVQHYSDTIPRKGFYFTLSGDAPSKNLLFLIQTFKTRLSDQKLIIAGVSENSPIRSETNENICFLDMGVSDAVLIQLYRECKAFIFLSLQEGFGIPVLEALICNAPVICSNTTSLPEITNGFAYLIEPTDSDALIHAIDEVNNLEINNEHLQQHLQPFLSWKESAQVTVNHLTKR